MKKLLKHETRQDFSKNFIKVQEGKAPEDVKQALAKKSINVSVSPANSTWLDFSQRGLDNVVRASVHYYNTEEEVHRFIAALKGL